MATPPQPRTARGVSVSFDSCEIIDNIRILLSGVSGHKPSRTLVISWVIGVTSVLTRRLWVGSWMEQEPLPRK